MERQHLSAPAAGRMTRRRIVPADIPSCLDALGLSHQLRGNEAVGLCPAHNDSHPSWSVNISTGQHHCFSCGFGGSFLHLVQYVRGGDGAGALRWVGERGSMVAESIAAPAVNQIRQYGEADLALFTEPPPQALASRSLTDVACRDLGILWDKDTWIIPIRDPETGKLWGWQRKNGHTVRNVPRGVAKSRTLFGAGAAGDGRMVLVESPLDTARLRAAGYRRGVASFGVNISAEQLRLVQGMGNRRFVVAFDNDTHGRRRARELGEYSPLLCRCPRWFNYDAVGRFAKDIGDMTDAEISAGIEGALDLAQMIRRGWTWKFKEEK